MSVRNDSGSGLRSVPEGTAPTSVRNAIAAAQRYLLSIQAEDGHWCGELEGDTILESEYILTLYFLGRTGEERVRKAAEYLRRKQLDGGGWAIYEGGTAEVSSSVKAYFVLKLVGDDPDAPHMVKARRVILELGGIEACNSFTRIYLAIFGQCSWDDCPAVPPEIVLLPDSFVFNIYKMSSWSRGIVVPLSVIWATKPSCAVPEHAAIPELHVTRKAAAIRGRTRRERFWRGFFSEIDHMLKRLEAARITPLRKRALAACERWIHERLVQSDGLGAIFPPIVNTLIAFRCLGYANDDPRIQMQARELERFELEDEETLHLQPCFSSIWDTALATVALSDSGLPAEDPALLKAGRWLLDHEVKKVGDWKKACPEAEPGGWYFEYANEWYPDTDDTAEVLTALARVKFPGEAEDLARQGAVARGQATTRF
jgi:squalene-hopene/tetraprenyl-beta-curcumene cyclase